MRLTRNAIRLLPFFACIVAAGADTVFLKNGEKLEGRVLSETETELTMSVQVTATIKDERVLKKADVDKILRPQPDVEAWTPLALLEPGADSLERDDYWRVQAALEHFVKSYPESSFVPEATKKREVFGAEQKRVEEGQMKLDGRWLTREQVLEERVQIGGRILLNRMKRAAAAGQHTDAMAVFDQMEKGFKGAASYPDAVELARQILPLLKSAAMQRQALLKRRAEEGKQRLKVAQGAEREQLALLLKNEQANAEAAVVAAERAGLKWLPLHPATERSLASLVSRTTSETARLASAQTAKMKDSVQRAEAAAAALAAGNLEAAEKAVREARSAWPDNELAKRIDARVSESKKNPPPAPPGAPKSSSTPVPPCARIPAFSFALSAVAAAGPAGVKASQEHRPGLSPAIR